MVSLFRTPTVASPMEEITRKYGVKYIAGGVQLQLLIYH